MKHIAKVFLALTIASLLLVGPASAHIRKESTTLHLKANKTQVQPKGVVKFTIQLKSDWKECKAHQPVRWYRNGVYRKTFQTNNKGKIVLNKHVKATSKYFAKYLGRQFGLHPHRHICYGSTSNTVRIKVKSS